MKNTSNVIYITIQISSNLHYIVHAPRETSHLGLIGGGGGGGGYSSEFLVGGMRLGSSNPPGTLCQTWPLTLYPLHCNCSDLVSRICACLCKIHNHPLQSQVLTF